MGNRDRFQSRAGRDHDIVLQASESRGVGSCYTVLLEQESHTLQR